MKRAIPSLLALAVLFGLGAQTASAQDAKPPTVAHELEGRDNCLMCHKTGVMEAPVAPAASHAERTNDTCMLCHGASSPMLAGTPATFSHALEGRENCLMCHKTGVMQAPVAPEASHAPIDVKHCTLCHKRSGG